MSLTALVLMLVLDLARGRLMRARWTAVFRREKTQLEVTLQHMGQAVGQLVDPPTVAQRLLQATTELLGVSAGLRLSAPGRAGASTSWLAWSGAACPERVCGTEPLIDTLHRQASVAIWPGAGSAPTPAQRQLQALGGELAHGLSHEGRLLAVLVLGPK